MRDANNYYWLPPYSNYRVLVIAEPSQSSTVVSHNPGIPVVPLTSDNWSGYLAESNLDAPENYAVTDVKGQWRVPSIDPSASNSYSAVWVGTDGWGSVTRTTMEQIGTEEDYYKGSYHYQIKCRWYLVGVNRAGHWPPGNRVNSPPRTGSWRLVAFA